MRFSSDISQDLNRNTDGKFLWDEIDLVNTDNPLRNLQRSLTTSPGSPNEIPESIGAQ